MKAKHLLCDDEIKWTDEGRVFKGKVTGIVKDQTADGNVHIQINYVTELYVPNNQEFEILTMVER